MQGNQVTEALPTGRHDTGRRNCFTFDARGEERHQEALQEMLQTFRKQTGHLHPTEGASSPLAIPRNPYKGLQAFHQKDATDFFGRDRLIDDLIEKVRQMLAPQPSERITSRLLTVVGASGSGKSSVVMAGL